MEAVAVRDRDRESMIKIAIKTSSERKDPPKKHPIQAITITTTWVVGLWAATVAVTWAGTITEITTTVTTEITEITGTMAVTTTEIIGTMEVTITVTAVTTGTTAVTTTITEETTIGITATITTTTTGTITITTTTPLATRTSIPRDQRQRCIRSPHVLVRISYCFVFKSLDQVFHAFQDHANFQGKDRCAT